VTTATEAPLIQYLADGPGELTVADHGKLFSWDNRRGRVVMLSQPDGVRVLVGGGGGGSGPGGTPGGGLGRIQDATDGPGVLGAGDNGKALVWNQASGRFVMAAIVSTPGGSTTQVQYNNGGVFAGDAGMTYDDVNNALILAGRLVTPALRPATDSTTALQFQNAAGTAVATIDTTNGLVGIGTTPAGVVLDIYKASASTSLRLRSDTLDAWMLLVRPTARVAYIAFATTSAPTAPTFQFGVDGNDTRFSIAGNNFFPQYLIITTTGTEARLTDAGTNLTTTGLIMDHRSSATPAAGFGVGFLARLHSTTTTGQSAGRLTWAWDVATHATRASKGQLTAFYTSTERPVITWGANSTVPLLSFYDVVSPIARQLLATGTGATVDQVITALQNLGLLRQS